MSEIARADAFDLLQCTEEEFDQKYNDLLELTDWFKNVKEIFKDSCLENGMQPGDFPVTLKSRYVDLQVIYPKQKVTFTIDEELMKRTEIQIVNDETGEVEEFNAYDYFKTKPKAPSKAYVKEIRHE